MDPIGIIRVKALIDKVIQLNSFEDSMLRQKSKIDWLTKGDSNSAYYYASIKSRSQHKSMDSLHKEDGIILTEQRDIQKEVIRFYTGLMGSKSKHLKHVD